MNHLDSEGRARMVDVGGKAATHRIAEVSARLLLKPSHQTALAGNPKGDALQVARIAGIQAAKRCGDLIPLCHPVALTHVSVNLTVEEEAISIRAIAETVGITGVEMEAYCAASVAGVTLIDMLKGIDPDLTLTDLRLESKTGGKSDFHRSELA